MKFDKAKPTYFDKDAGIALFQGDCIEILPLLVEDLEGQVNMILTDPPYGINYASNHRTSNDILGKVINNDQDLTVMDRALPHLDKLLNMNTAAYFFGHPNMIGENRKLLDKFWKHKNTLVWDKGDAGTFGDLEAGYSLNYESIFYYNKGRRKLNGKRPRTILRYDHSQLENRLMSEISADEWIAALQTAFSHMPDDIRYLAMDGIAPDILGKIFYDVPKAQLRKDWSSRNDPVHATTKPVHLLEILIRNSSDEFDIVIDPFMGSGTTGAACKRQGRFFIGIEMSPHFYRVAQDRIHNT